MYSYIARQPIFNSSLQVVAYELLFRDGKSNSFPNIDPDQATSNILTHNQLTLGVESITGNLPAYINFHTEALIQHFPLFLDPEKVVIEILEDVTASYKVLKACKLLKSKGYILALDDYDFDTKWDCFFPYIDIIKIDVLESSILQMSKFINTMSSSNIKFLAEKVETAQEFEKFKMLGFDLFQGYFFAKPEMLKQRKLSTAQHNILSLIEHANRTQLDFDTLSDIFSGDPGLTYKLLRFINSPIYGRSQAITSLKHALAYIGELELKKFIALLALTDLAQYKPIEIMRLSLVRAKFSEQMSAICADAENPPKAFLTGILSMIDGILDQELISILNILPVHADIKVALIDKNNYLSHYLMLAKQLEQGDWQASTALAKKLNIELESCLNMYQIAIKWADEMLLTN